MGVPFDPVDGEMGTYKFELSRSLTTAPTMQDAQMAPGGVYDFGIAYWDPYETATGWTKAGHYLTGCSKDWIKLALDDGSSNPTLCDLTTDVTAETNGQSSGVASSYNYGPVSAIARCCWPLSLPSLPSKLKDKRRIGVS